MYIPPGFNTVTPYFFVEGAENFVSFLVNGLGGTETCRTMRPNGLIANVQVQIGTSTVMVSEATEKCKSMAAAYYLYVEDAHASMRRALEHGPTRDGGWRHALRGQTGRSERPQRQYLVDLATHRS